MASLGVMRFAIVLAAVVLLALAGAARADECKADMKGLTVKCSTFVGKPGPIADPSQACCDVIKNTDVPCICRHITGAMELFLNMEKVVHVAQFCGKPLPQGSKCGSYTVPPLV